MAKFYGIIGYAASVEKEPGVWGGVVERKYSGDFVKTYSHNSASNNVNSDVVVNGAISIVADPYANDNLTSIRYIKWRNNVWTVTNVEVQYPRLVLTLGGVYNGEQA